METTSSNHGAVENNRMQIFSFCEELAEPVKKVIETAWVSRGKLARDVTAYATVFGGQIYSMPGRAMKVINNPKLHKFIEEEEDPEAFAAVVAGFGGSLCVASVGAIVGIGVGGTIGTMAGAVPALFTLGLSLPVGAVIGGASGLATGTAIGGSAGFVGGAVSGCTVSYFRGEIRGCAVYVTSIVYDVYNVLILRPVTAVKGTTKRVRNTVHESANYSKAKAQAMGEVVKDVASNPQVQVTAVSAGVGAVSVGTAGATGGALIGGSAGALVGLIPAVFTFGLSIPIGAVVGSGTGICIGGATGTAVGFMGGGTIGCIGYSLRKAPGTTFQYVKAKTASMAGIINSPAVEDSN